MAETAWLWIPRDLPRGKKPLGEKPQPCRKMRKTSVGETLTPCRERRNVTSPDLTFVCMQIYLPITTG
jgi:hypothetical protein